MFHKKIFTIWAFFLAGHFVSATTITCQEWAWDCGEVAYAMLFYSEQNTAEIFHCSNQGGQFHASANVVDDMGQNWAHGEAHCTDWDQLYDNCVTGGRLVIECIKLLLPK